MPALVTTRSPLFKLAIRLCCCCCRFFCGRIITKYMMMKMKISGTKNEPIPPPVAIFKTDNYPLLFLLPLLLRQNQQKINVNKKKNKGKKKGADTTAGH